MKKETGKSKGNTPNPTQTSKARTPPSLEHVNQLQKRQNMEESAMEIEIASTDVIIRGKVSNNNNTDITRRNMLEDPNDDTRSNTETTRRNTEVGMPATGGNKITAMDMTRRNNDVLIENPFETEGDDDETLEDLGPELAKMGRILAREITRSLEKALIPLQNEINELKKPNYIPPATEMQEILKENDRLKTKVNQLELNNIKLTEKLNRIEDQLLENNLMCFGINEKDGETEYERYNTILDIISTTFVGPTYDSQVQQGSKIQIEKLVRKGRYNQQRARPISVTFTHHKDLQELLANRKYLPTGISVSREFGEHTENERKFLKPILRVANSKIGYHKRCHLEGDQLVIKGKYYTRDNIEELPKDISGFKITSKEDDDTVGFFRRTKSALKLSS